MGHLTFDRTGWVIFQMKNLTDLERKQHSCGVISLIITPVFSLAKSLQLIFKKQRNLQVSYLLAVNWLICRLYAQCMISKSHVKQCSAWLFLWCYWTSKQCIVKCNVTVHHGQGIHHCLVFNNCLEETLLESTKNGCQGVYKILREPMKFSPQFYGSLLKATSCLSSLMILLENDLPTGLLSIWQVSFQTDLPSKKIYLWTSVQHFFRTLL